VHGVLWVLRPGDALAGHAGTLWQVQDHSQALHALGGERRLGRVFEDLLKDRITVT
jgi:hypothetical protein